MGCAGSNPLPSSDTMGSLKMTDTNDPNQTSSMVQKMVDNINNASIDDIVKKIQDVTGSMDNLMDETQEKLSSFFGKVEQKTENVKETVENNVNDTTSVISENPIIHEVIILTVEETKVIPIDEVKLEMLKNRNDSVFEEVTNQTKEKQTKIKTKEVQNEDIEKQNEEEKVEEIEKQNEKGEVEEIEKRNEEKKVEKNEENINEKKE